jgi:two-component system, chemotaxis family, CheB/CheR fusion protein
VATKKIVKKPRKVVRAAKIESTPQRSSRGPFPIVGVGASAGGLESFMEMFKTLPQDTGMSFVLVQHLSPQHMSILSSIIQKATRMQVQEAEDQTKVEPNHVYIIPPNATLEIFHGVLHLSSMVEPHGRNMPVNTFFHPLHETKEIWLWA